MTQWLQTWKTKKTNPPPKKGSGVRIVSFMIVKFISVVLHGSKRRHLSLQSQHAEQSSNKMTEQKQNIVKRKKLKGALFFLFFFSLLWSDQHSRENQSSTVKHLREQFVLIHSCSPRLPRTTTCVFYVFWRKKATVQAFHNDDIHIQQFGTYFVFSTRWRPIFKHLKDQRGGKLMVINPFREAEKHESFPVKQSYTAWRNKRVLREKS